ncbi:MAG: hypothetical protein HOQ02_08490, partial [Lysobacter sp.]|nr:hypothetical protein [Lysobacter sp.]
MTPASDRAVVDEYVEALLAPVEALHAEPQEPAPMRAIARPASVAPPVPAARAPTP